MGGAHATLVVGAGGWGRWIAGLGAATKSGCAKLAGTLCATFPAEMAPFAARLVKTMTAVAAAQRSTPVRRDYAAAIGAVVRVAPLDVCEAVCTRCRALYLARASDEAVETSAAICRAMALKAPDVLRAVAAAVCGLVVNFFWFRWQACPTFVLTPHLFFSFFGAWLAAGN